MSSSLFGRATERGPRPSKTTTPIQNTHTFKAKSSQDAWTIFIIRCSTILFIFSILNHRALAQSASSSQQQQQQQREEAQQLKCLACIRQVSSIGLQGDLSKQKCEGYYCGPFQFSYQYWAEAGKPRANSTNGVQVSGTGRDFERCARDTQCAEQAVRAYFKRFKRDCNQDGRIDCLDMAALHKGGPTSCASDWFYKSRFWQAFNGTTCARSPLEDSSAGDDLEGAAGSSSNNNNNKSRDEANRVIKKNQTLTSECLDCICEALTSCGALTTSAHNCGSGSVCGPFALSQAYWKDGRRPGASWTACARTRECSVVTIRNYMEKNKRDCNDDGFITCEDYAAIHRRGPRSCTNRDVLREPYWQKFLACQAAQQRSVNDANMVKLDGVGDLASKSEPTSLAPDISSSSLGSTQASPLPFQSSPSGSQDKPARHEPGENHFVAAQNPNYELSPVHADQLDRSTTVLSTTHQYSTRTRPRGSTLATASATAAAAATTTVVMATTTTTTTTTASTSTTTAAPPLTSSSEVSQPRAEVSSNQQTRPTINYSQLPTIIVSKPLGAASTQWFSPASSSLSPSPEQSRPSVRHQSGPLSSTTPSLSSSSGQAASSNDDDSVIDYSIPEPFPFVSPSGGIMGGEEIVHDAVDRTSFDKVVNGIVANPDFSKSYPPTPNPTESTQSTRRKQTTSQDLAPSSSPISEQQVPSQRSRINANSLNHFDQSANREQQQQPQHQEPRLSSAQGSSTASLGPPDALSVSGLLEMSMNESARIASECLDCICDASSNCDTTVQCISKQREKNRCGLYMISWNQYKESDISLASLMVGATGGSSASTGYQQVSPASDDYDEKLYYECSTDKNCAEKLIHLYMEKHQKDCNNDGRIDCFDIAAIHRVGPDLCNSGKFLSSQYWKDFNICYATDRLATAATAAAATLTTTSTTLPSTVTHQVIPSGRTRPPNQQHRARNQPSRLLAI